MSSLILEQFEAWVHIGIHYQHTGHADHASIITGPIIQFRFC